MVIQFILPYMPPLSELSKKRYDRLKDFGHFIANFNVMCQSAILIVGPKFFSPKVVPCKGKLNTEKKLKLSPSILEKCHFSINFFETLSCQTTHFLYTSLDFFGCFVSHFTPGFIWHWTFYLSSTGLEIMRYVKKSIKNSWSKMKKNFFDRNSKCFGTHLTQHKRSLIFKFQLTESFEWGVMAVWSFSKNF